jgi:hypothetical protein
VAPHFKARTVSSGSTGGFVCMNPTRGVDVCECLFCVFVVLSVDGDFVTELMSRPSGPTDFEQD